MQQTIMQLIFEIYDEVRDMHISLQYSQEQHILFFFTDLNYFVAPETRAIGRTGASPPVIFALPIKQKITCVILSPLKMLNNAFK